MLGAAGHEVIGCTTVGRRMALFQTLALCSRPQSTQWLSRIRSWGPAQDSRARPLQDPVPAGQKYTSIQLTRMGKSSEGRPFSQVSCTIVIYSWSRCSNRGCKAPQVQLFIQINRVMQRAPAALTRCRPQDSSQLLRMQDGPPRLQCALPVLPCAWTPQLC